MEEVLLLKNTILPDWNLNLALKKANNLLY